MNVPDFQNILIVEDDAIIGMLLEEFLSMAGRQPVAVVDAVAPALARLAEGGIDAAIVDLNLCCGETSDPVATALAAANIPFIVATGAFIGDLDPVWRDRPLLEKPFTLASVMRSLEELG